MHPRVTFNIDVVEVSESSLSKGSTVVGGPEDAIDAGTGGLGGAGGLGGVGAPAVEGASSSSRIGNAQAAVPDPAVDPDADAGGSSYFDHRNCRGELGKFVCVDTEDALKRNTRLCSQGQIDELSEQDVSLVGEPVMIPDPELIFSHSAVCRCHQCVDKDRVE